MKYLFWNTAKNSINDILIEIVKNYSIDIICLAEYEDNIIDLIKKLSSNHYDYFHIPQIACRRIQIITKYKPGQIQHYPETSYYTIKKLPHDTLGYQMLICVHLPSKLHMDEQGYLALTNQLRRDIEDAESQANNNNTIVVGDFNINPFESSMVSAHSLHAIPSRKTASRLERRIYGQNYSMFYNPMWNLFGDFEETPGTYYYSASKHLCYFWNIFDQVIVRPSIADCIAKNSLKIITNIKDINLSSTNGNPNKTFSDHYPLYFEIKKEV